LKALTSIFLAKTFNSSSKKKAENLEYDPCQRAKCQAVGPSVNQLQDYPVYGAK
jgi:hypothetical protein